MLLPRNKLFSRLSPSRQVSGDRDENNNIINSSCGDKPVIRERNCDRDPDDQKCSRLLLGCEKENLKSEGEQESHSKLESSTAQPEERQRFEKLNQRIEIGFHKRKRIAERFDESRKLKESNESKKEKSVYLWHGNDYYFIRKGDFDIVKFNVFIFAIGHLCYFYALYLLLSGRVMVLTYVHCFWMTNWAGVGIGSGAHRLWAHKSYEARIFFKTFLMIGQLMAGQNCLFIWCRDHRVHHKFSDTDADPHNTKRGFFFSHVGWLLRKKHPEMKAKGATLDFSDLINDPVVRFQTEHYWSLYFFVAVLIPVAIPVYLWNESLTVSLFISYFLRYVTSLHCTWFVNSSAHMFGDRPYNGSIAPRENYWVSFGSFGEGYHNYHHSFPRDYATSELPYFWNINKVFIDTFAWMGQAHNLKKPSNRLIESFKIKELERRRKRREEEMLRRQAVEEAAKEEESSEEEEDSRLADLRTNQIKCL